MMYSNKFVVSVKSNGKFLREDDKSTILLPFGSEYSLYLKNMDSRKAVASISIDGQDVLDGSRIIVPANSFVELNGFMDGNIVKNCFRFIEKTKQIEEFRGNDPLDGLVRVEYWFEEERGYSITYTPSTAAPFIIYSYYNSPSTTYTLQKQSENIAEDTCFCCSSSDGITVEGNETRQVFGNGYIGDTGKSSIIVLQLKGYNLNQEQVETLITTRDKIICKICGEKNPSKHKFCTNCGTYLR